jgi:hypothetical protein
MSEDELVSVADAMFSAYDREESEG